MAPSAIQVDGETHIRGGGKASYEVPRALETSELPRLIDDYINAAKNAKVAGFDGVEIHGANGYLLDTFLQSSTNLRTDNYGGWLFNFVRFCNYETTFLALLFKALSSRIAFDLSVKLSKESRPFFLWNRLVFASLPMAYMEAWAVRITSKPSPMQQVRWESLDWAMYTLWMAWVGASTVKGRFSDSTMHAGCLTRSSFVISAIQRKRRRE